MYIRNRGCSKKCFWFEYTRLGPSLHRVSRHRRRGQGMEEDEEEQGDEEDIGEANETETRSTTRR